MNILFWNRWKCIFCFVFILGLAIPTHAYLCYGRREGKIFSQPKGLIDINKTKSSADELQPIFRKVDLALSHEVAVRGGAALSSIQPEGALLDYTTVITNNGPDNIPNAEPAIFFISTSGLILNPNEVVADVKLNKAAQEANARITYRHTYPSGDIYHILNFPKDGSLTLTYSAIVQQPIYGLAHDFADCSVSVAMPSKGYIEINSKNNTASKRIKIAQFTNSESQSEVTGLKDVEPLEAQQTENKRAEFADIPRIFSPNDDGINDFWIIPGIGQYPNCEIIVFDRAENIVYQSVKGYQEPWNGRINNTGDTLPSRSNFHYKIDLNDEFRRVIVGYVSIVR